MIKLNITDLQNILQKPIKRNCRILGLDVAARTGWCVIYSNSKKIEIDYGFINLKTPDMYFKFDKFIEEMSFLIKKDDIVVIEDSFMQNNAWVLKMLAKMEGIAYTVARLNKAKSIQFIMASSSRKTIGIKGNCKKADVANWLSNNLKVNLEDEDAADAIVLGLVGVLQNKV